MSALHTLHRFPPLLTWSITRVTGTGGGGGHSAQYPLNHGTLTGGGAVFIQLNTHSTMGHWLGGGGGGVSFSSIPTQPWDSISEGHREGGFRVLICYVLGSLNWGGWGGGERVRFVFCTCYADFLFTKIKDSMLLGCCFFAVRCCRHWEDKHDYGGWGNCASCIKLLAQTLFSSFLSFVLQKMFPCTFPC